MRTITAADLFCGAGGTSTGRMHQGGFERAENVSEDAVSPPPWSNRRYIVSKQKFAIMNKDSRQWYLFVSRRIRTRRQKRRTLWNIAFQNPWCGYRLHTLIRFRKSNITNSATGTGCTYITGGAVTPTRGAIAFTRTPLKRRLLHSSRCSNVHARNADRLKGRRVLPAVPVGIARALCQEVVR